MKRNLLIFCVLSVFILAISSCFHKQQSKMIPASHVKLSGEHKGLLEVAADSVKIMLVESIKNGYEVRAIIPIRNTVAWSDITGGSDEYKAVLDARMSNINVYFTDEYGSDIKELFNNLDVDHDIIESVIRSEQPTTEDLLVKDKNAIWGDKSYRFKKQTFDKVDGIVISQINVTKGKGKDFDETMDRIERVLNVVEKISVIGI